MTEGTGSTSRGVPLESSPEKRKVRDACRRFLFQEAEYLDDRRLEAWLELLSDDVQYEILIRSSRERSAPEFSGEGYHVRDDKDTLRTRAERLDSEFAWVEHPPSRTRRFVGNVRVSDSADGEFRVKSNALLHRAQGDTAESVIVSGERRDRIRVEDDHLKLAYRKVLLTHTKLPFDRMTLLTYL